MGQEYSDYYIQRGTRGEIYEVELSSEMVHSFTIWTEAKQIILLPPSQTTFLLVSYAPH